jgi:hypothetical protein
MKTNFLLVGLRELSSYVVTSLYKALELFVRIRIIQLRRRKPLARSQWM